MEDQNKEFYTKIYNAHKSILDGIFLAAKGEIPSGKIKVKNPDLTNLVNQGVLKLTDKLIFKHRKKNYVCNLIEEDGIIRIGYDGEVYSSISTAIEKISDWHTNGWENCKVKTIEGDDKGSLAELRKSILS